MEKYSWKQKTGQKLLEAYERIRPLEQSERGVYRADAGLPGEILEDGGQLLSFQQSLDAGEERDKLALVLRQSEEKSAFLEQIFSVVI